MLFPGFDLNLISEAENEHFEIIDNVISWMETCKTSTTRLPNSSGDELNSRTSRDANNSTLGSSTKSQSPSPHKIRDLPYDCNDGGFDDEVDLAVPRLADRLDSLRLILPPNSMHHELSAPGVAWNLVKIFCERQGSSIEDTLSVVSSALDTNVASDKHLQSSSPSNESISPSKSSESQLELSTQLVTVQKSNQTIIHDGERSDTNDSQRDHQHSTEHQQIDSNVRMRGNDEWAPPRAQIIFNIHEEMNFRKLMQRQNYRCAGCGTKIDLDLARRLVLYCYYLGKYFCKCCFSHKAIHLPCYILQKWDFHKYPVSHFALQLLDKIANEPLFNINDINPTLYKKVKKLRLLVDIRMQLYYLKIYVSTCTQTNLLHKEYTSFGHQHLLQDDVHVYSLNNLIEIQHGKLYEYLNDLVARTIAHIAQCDRCRAKGHYCQLCGPSSLMSSTNSGNNSIQTHELIFPFEIGRVAQCGVCGCCFHLQCFVDGGQNCPKCERMQRRKAEASGQLAALNQEGGSSGSN